MKSLLKSLVDAMQNNYSFHVKYSTDSDVYDQQKMDEARRLEKDGYIKLTRCDTNDTVNDAIVVTLKGTFTKKGIKYIEKMKE